MFEPSQGLSVLMIVMSVISMLCTLNDIIANIEKTKTPVEDMIYMAGARISMIVLFSLWFIKKSPEYASIGQTIEFQTALCIAGLFACIAAAVDMYHDSKKDYPVE